MAAPRNKVPSAVQEQAARQDQDRAALLLLALAFWPEFLASLRLLWRQQPSKDVASRVVLSVIDRLQAVGLDAAVAAALTARLYLAVRTGTMPPPTTDTELSVLRTRYRPEVEALLPALVAHLKTTIQTEDDLEAAGVGEHPFLITAITEKLVHLAYQDAILHPPPAAAAMIPAYQYCTMRDDRVRPSHRAAEGRIIAADDAEGLAEVQALLDDWGCRCVLVPLLTQKVSQK